MNKSESIKELASALAKAQAKLKNPAFDSNNPHFKSKYASLASVRDTVFPILSEFGLAVCQLPRFEDGRAGCETILMHSSGEWLSETLLIPVDRPNAHGVGSCTTYARRFSLMAIAGVVGDDDDDGNAAVEPQKGHKHKPTDGCWENVPVARHEPIRAIGNSIIDLFAADDPKGAYEFLSKQKWQDPEEKICVWTMLESSIRSKLKAMEAENRKSNLKLAEQA